MSGRHDQKPLKPHSNTEKTQNRPELFVFSRIKFPATPPREVFFMKECPSQGRILIEQRIPRRLEKKVVANENNKTVNVFSRGARSVQQ